MLLAAVSAFDGDAVDALRIQRGAELAEFGEVGQHVGPFVVAERLRRLVVVEQRGWIARVVQERVEWSVVDVHRVATQGVTSRG